MRLSHLERRRLFTALAERPAEADRFLGVLAGTVPIGRFFNPAHLARLVGVRTMLGALRQR